MLEYIYVTAHEISPQYRGFNLFTQSIAKLFYDLLGKVKVKNVIGIKIRLSGGGIKKIIPPTIDDEIAVCICPFDFAEYLSLKTGKQKHIYILNLIKQTLLDLFESAEVEHLKVRNVYNAILKTKFSKGKDVTDFYSFKGSPFRVKIRIESDWEFCRAKLVIEYLDKVPYKEIIFFKSSFDQFWFIDQLDLVVHKWKNSEVLVVSNSKKEFQLSLNIYNGQLEGLLMGIKDDDYSEEIKRMIAIKGERG